MVGDTSDLVIPLASGPAPMLGRTLLYPALTRARRLVVIVGQRKALFLAVREWRRATRHTALSGLVDGTLRFGWTERRDPSGGGEVDASPAAWEGPSDGTSSE